MVQEKYENGTEYILCRNEWIERIRKTTFSAKCKCGKEIAIHEYYSLRCCYECYALEMLENEIKIFTKKKSETINEKTCKICGITKPISEFTTGKSMCKICRNILKREQNLLNKKIPTQEELELKEQEKLIKQKIAKEKQRIKNKEKNKIKANNKRMAKLAELNPEFTIEFQIKNPDKTICLMCYQIVDLVDMANTKRCNECQEVWWEEFIKRKNKQKNDAYNAQDKHEYYLKNKDKLMAYKKTPANKKYQKEYYEVRKEEIAEKKKAYYQTPQGKITSNKGSIKRRQLLATCIDTLTVDEWLDILGKQNYKCAHCGVELKPYGFDLDHIVPLSKGGDNIKENVQGLCEHCNSVKHNKIESLAMEMILMGLQ